MKTPRKLQNPLFNHRFVFDKPCENPPPVEGERKEKEPDGKAERADLADEPAEEATRIDQADKESPAGKVHKSYFDRIKAAPEESAEKDRQKLKDAEIKTIRFKSRFLKGKADKEDEATQAAGVKEETEKRIKAYSDKSDEKWYTLNYQNLGSDKRGRSHEMNIGLGDILLDPDIKEILVKKKGGEVIKAHRGVVPGRQMYAGRQAFLDANNSYVATLTGDSFRILSNDETDFKDQKALKKYLSEFSADEKVREENEKHFEDEMKAQEDQDVYYTEANLDPNKSVAEQIKLPLTASQRANAEIIEKVFKEGLEGKGIPPEGVAKIIAAAIVNAYKESKLNAGAIGDHGNSVGLFQLNIAGAGHGMSVEARQDPTTNAKTILDREVLGNYGRVLISRATAGATLTELTALFSRYIERPRDVYASMQARSKAALRMFGERVSDTGDEIAERIDNGEKSFNGKGIMKLQSNQNTWIFGSSGAVAMNNMKTGLNLGNTGFFGIVGINPMKFLAKLQAEWPRIAKLKLPKQIVLVGMAVNGVGTKDSPSLIEKNLNAYASIKSFLEEKGVKVKIATVQPAENVGEQVSKFNDKLREKYDSDTLIDIAKYTTTEDGKHINPEYAAADGIHLSRRGYKTFAKLINPSGGQGGT
ncbi:hypothetical protein HZA40_05295 [Candidatus Peregrinibacteria bacterium]|nr:hypothetical protein [Candidatus Peregrinibacteria bacterium]